MSDLSQLYIRVKTGFYSHRKTARLKSLIGSDALWLPPRLWAYCAENQPDGDVSGYSAGELAELVGYLGDAQAMLQALKTSEFVDADGMIHNWEEHNGYHTTYAIRAKKAADARWGKKRAVRVQPVPESLVVPPLNPPVLPYGSTVQKEKEIMIRKGEQASPSIATSIPLAQPTVKSTTCEVEKTPMKNAKAQNLGKTNTAFSMLEHKSFSEAWEDWQEHRKQKRAKLTDVTISRQLSKLSGMGLDRAIAAINHSIEMGWLGIFEPKSNGNGHHPKANHEGGF